MSGPRFPSFYDGYNAEMYRALTRREIREKYCSPRQSRNPHRANPEDRTPSTSASRQDQASSTPSTLTRTSALPDFKSPVKPQQPTTESSSVRSSLTESLSSECKSEICLSKSERPDKAISKKKFKSWESITPKNSEAKKKFFEASKKLRASFLAVWFGSKPSLFPSSRSPSRLSKLRNLFLKFVRRNKVKKGEDNNQQGLTDSSQSSPSQVSNSSKNKTKDASYSESTNKTNPTSTTTATTTSTTTTTTTSTTTTTATNNNEYIPANVEDTQDSKYFKTKRLVSTDDAAHRLSTAYYDDQPQFSSYDRTEQERYSGRRRIKRRVPNLEHLYPHLKNAPSQRESCHQVQNRHDKYVEPKSTVLPENVSNDYKKLIPYSEEIPPPTHWSCSEGTQHDVRGQPRQGQDGSSPNYAVTRQDLQQHSFESDGKEVLSSSDNNSQKVNKQIVQHQFEEKRFDQRATVYTAYNQAKQEQIKEDSFEQSPHGAIRRQPLQHSQSKNEKKVSKTKEQKTIQLQHDAISQEQSRNKHFEYQKQYRSKVEKFEDNKVRFVKPKNKNDLEENYSKSESHKQFERQQQSGSESNPISGNEIRHRGLQQQRCKQDEQIQLASEIHEEKTKSKQQHSVESDQSRPGIKQLQNTPQSTVSPKRILPKISELIKFQSSESKQKKQEYTSQVAKHDQLPQQQLAKYNVKQLQGQRHQIEHKQVEEQGRVQRFDDPSIYSQKFFWRREVSHKLELDSPCALVNSEIEDIHIEESPEPPSEHPNESIEIHYQDNLPHEDINVTELTDLRHRRFNEYRMGRMGSLEDHERKVIIEFCHLLEKSKQLFNGLRELPQYGHKQWHSYFGRTFDVYTKLWKFQQQHRSVLDNKYGLKRWQIGEIASKIGQLYYHFYLRTSETAYLNEAFSFYSAIRGRSYYTKASKEDKCELMVKKLRYYARYIVVCLLLKKVKLVRELIKELDRQIIEYGNTYDPDDQAEWNIVVEEVKAFLQAEPVVSVIHPDNYTVILSHRLSTVTTPLVERTSQMNLSLQEVLIVGSSSQQVKFSELTMDMFRMLHTLEREPNAEVQQMYDDSPRQRFNLTPSTLNTKGYNLEMAAPRCENPHKYLLFKPSPSQILVYLASGCNDLPPNGALLLYISADGQIVQSSKHPEDGYDIGGLITTSKTDFYRDSNKEKGSQSKYKEVQCLHPGDLYPFTRRPMFIIIDSDNSYVFNNIPRHFGQPLVVLMSPIELPSSLHVSERRHQGSLFTLFLHAPLTAFCHCCDIHTIPLVHWDRAQSYIDAFIAEALQLLMRSRIDIMILCFMNDDFLRVLMLRFIFCEVVLRMHRAFRARTHLTRCSPPLPDDLLEHPALTHIVMDLAAHLQVRGNFHDPSAIAVGGPADDRRPPKE